jgi:hypothetical protein
VSRERRQHPRIELAAQVEVSSSAVLHLLRAVNASRGGLFLEGTPGRYPHLREGVAVDLRICEISSGDDGDGDGDSVDVRASGRVVRVEEPAGEARGGFAVEFTRLGEDDARALDKLLGDG